MEINNLTTKEFAAFIESTTDKEYYEENLGYIPEGLEETEYSLRYSEFIALNTFMIQKLYKKVEQLEQELYELKLK